ncbi:MAG: MotA/TolQ/ExbB proton channel family protein [Verrucomicrobiota bacterium]
MISRKEIWFSIFIACLLGAFSASGDPLAEISEQGRAQAREALSELREFRLSVEQEALPLETRVRELREQLDEAQRRLEQFREAADSSAIALSELQDEKEKLSLRRQTIESLLDEIIGSHAVAPRYGEREIIKSLWKEWTSTRGTADQLLLAEPILVQVLSDLSSEVGGNISSLTVFLPTGQKIGGIGLSLGPLLYFAAQGVNVGMVDSSDPVLPTLRPSVGKEEDLIRNTLADRSGILPIDPTGGVALALRDSQSGLTGEIRQAGIWIYPILIAAIVALVVVLLKWTMIARTQMAFRRGIPLGLRFQANPGKDTLRKLLKDQPEQLRSFWETLYSSGGIDPDSREDLLFARLIEVRLRLTKGLAALSVIAATTPLLGLLGTVTGMIATFQQITLFGQGDPRSLSGGISEALLTTKYGLIVAIPTFLIYAYLSRKAHGTVSDLENFARAAESPEQG